MALLTLRDIRKSFDGRELFEDIALTIQEGERVGLVGPNGAGKTTLLRIIAGFEEPDAGERKARKGLRIAYLEQEPHVGPDRSIRDVVRGGLRGDDGEHRVEEMISRLGLPDPDTMCGTLSGGEGRRVALARVLLEDPDLLLLDEPTNHLDAFVTAWLEDVLLATRMPLVMVTHDRYFLDRVTSRIVEVERGRLFGYEGGYAAFLAKRMRRLSSERKAEATRLNLLRRESEWISRGPQGRGTKAKARIERYHGLVDADRGGVPDDLELIIPPGPHLGTKVFTLKGAAKRELFTDLDLVVEQGERLGIVGPNGAGKTTMLKVMLGLLEPDRGTVEVGETVKPAYIDQSRADLDPHQTMLRAIAGHHTSVKIGTRLVRIESFLGRFLFDPKQFQTPVGKLSGGERNRVLLAKLLLQGGNVLVLDEPTNDLDLMTLRVLEEALLAFPGSALIVSHDRYFLDRVATRIVYLDGKGGVREWPGDMSGLLEKLKEEKAPRARKPKPAREKTATRKKRSYNEQRELDGLPDRIAALEAELEAIDAKLANPDIYQRRDVKDITTRRKEAAVELDRLLERWEELENIE